MLSVLSPFAGSVCKASLHAGTVQRTSRWTWCHAVVVGIVKAHATVVTSSVFTTSPSEAVESEDKMK